MFLIISIIFFIFCVVLSFFLGKIAIGSIRENKWGINIYSVNCPKCGEKMPTVREPKSISQAFWGGWTCPKCGCEMDKWGNEISTVSNESLPPRQFEESKIETINPFDKEGKTPVERIFEDND